MLKGKTVVLGVTGSIAAYKIANLASMLVKQHCDVHVIMSRNAANFIHPLTFETLTGNRCLTDMFDRNFKYDVEHVSLAKKADLILIAPASANVLAKLAHGMADDMLTTTVLACECKKIAAPAMNTRMYQNAIVQENIAKLKAHDFEVITPATGMLACRDIGEGKLPDEQLLMDYILREIAFEKDLRGKKILVTAGATREAIDPVRFITNHSTGKMGYAAARMSMLRGADVTLVSGAAALSAPPFVKMINVITAREMFEEVTARFREYDIVIKAAAVADYRPLKAAGEKLKKTDGRLTLEMEKTDDILQYLGDHKQPEQILCGFSMETQNMAENSRAKLLKKNLDLIVANNLKEAGAGFGEDTNIVTIITREEETALAIMSKEEVSNQILDQIIAIGKNKKE